MSRFQRPQREDPNAWLLTLVDDDGNETAPAYNPKTDPLSDEYRSLWIVDYRAIVAQEERDFPRSVTRIDLVETEYGPAKRTWLAGWMPEDPPAKYGSLAAGWTIASAADHLEAQGWKVRRWGEPGASTSAPSGAFAGSNTPRSFSVSRDRETSATTPCCLTTPHRSEHTHDPRPEDRSSGDWPWQHR